MDRAQWTGQYCILSRFYAHTSNQRLKTCTLPALDQAFRYLPCKMRKGSSNKLRDLLTQLSSALLRDLYLHDWWILPGLQLSLNSPLLTKRISEDVNTCLCWGILPAVLRQFLCTSQRILTLIWFKVSTTTVVFTCGNTSGL